MGPRGSPCGTPVKNQKTGKHCAARNRLGVKIQLSGRRSTPINSRVRHAMSTAVSCIAVSLNHHCGDIAFSVMTKDKRDYETG